MFNAHCTTYHELPRQVIENIRLQSCEGLALPFLANWFLGMPAESNPDLTCAC